MHLGAYRAQQEGYGHPLQFILSRKVEERGKNTWEKSSLKKEKRKKFEQHVFNMYLCSLEWAEWTTFGEIFYE